jgi:hypothetical protein
MAPKVVDNGTTIEFSEWIIIHAPYKWYGEKVRKSKMQWILFFARRENGHDLSSSSGILQYFFNAFLMIKSWLKRTIFRRKSGRRKFGRIMQ